MSDEEIIAGPDCTLLVDKRNEIAGPGLHALVIGVSRYEGLPEPALLPPIDSPTDPRTFGLTQVRTPATSAWKIAQWLRDQYNNPTAPLKTLRLLVSSSEEELAAVDGLRAVSTPGRRANREKVWQAMLRWRKDCTGGGGLSAKNVSMFYASGHGLQWGDKDGGMVLLDDFVGRELPVNHSISFSGVHEGMSGEAMPQTQLYFADACRVRPEAAKYLKDAGRGLQFRITWNGRDERSAPIYFAAAPQGHAQGVLQDGTFFSRALIECFNVLAATAPTNELDDSPTASSWHVKVEDVLRPLEKRVTALARDHGEEQAVVLGGTTRSRVFHILRQPPPVILIIDVAPDEMAQATEAELVQNGQCIRARAGNFPRPVTWSGVEAGLYILNVQRNELLLLQRAINPRPPSHIERVPL